MPMKFTWKSLVGLLSLLGGVATAAAQVKGIPTDLSTALVTVGGAILSVERVADAWDNKTSLSAAIAGVTKYVEPTVQKVETEHPHLAADLAKAQADAQAAIDRLQELQGKATPTATLA